MAVAQFLGVSRFAVGEWEAGNKYPKAKHLQAFIQLMLQQRVFPAGSEAEAIRALWQAAHQKVLLDESWLAGLLSPASQYSDVTPDATHPLGTPRMDWGDALSVPAFYGREDELHVLGEWLVQDRCRVVSVLGMGGIGKSALSIKLMHQIAGQFDIVIWRSLRDLPTCDVLLTALLQVLAPHVLGEEDASFERRLGILLEHMRKTRVLLVLDNLETVLAEGENSGQMLPAYEGFARFLRRSAETTHESSVLLTSREKPSVLISLEGVRSPVRALRLARLDAAACEALLAEKAVTGSVSERKRLLELYAGNPLALKIVAQTIVDLFDGEIAPFLEQGEVIFGGVRHLLSEQFARLSELEQSVFLWLAILREPATLDELLEMLVTPVPRARLLEAIESLNRRSLIERGQQRASFTLQSVVMEYATAQLIADVSSEIERGQMKRLIEYGLELAQVPEYVRQTQARLIITPILAQLRRRYPQPNQVDEWLLTQLAHLSTQPTDAQGYGAANLVTLLKMQRGNLRGLDLSNLVLRNLYLQGIEMQDTSLSGTIIRDSIFSESFDIVTAVAVSNSGAYWAASSSRGEIRVWEAGGKTLHSAWRAHADMVWSLAFSPDGTSLASVSWDSTVKVTDITRGILLWSGEHTSPASRVAFSPDGRMLASSGNDAVVRLWDARTGTPLQTLPHPGAVNSVTWSPDGHLIATGDVKGDIRIWAVSDIEQAHCILTLVEHDNLAEGLAFSPDGNVLASASWDNTVKLWEVSSGNLLRTLTGHHDRATRVAWSPDGHTLASASRDQTIWLWNALQGRYRAVLRGHTSAVSGLSFTPDSNQLVSSSEDGTLRVWDVAHAQCRRIIQGYTASLYDVDWSPDGNRLVSCSTDYLVSIYHVNDESPPLILQGHTGVVYGVGWSPEGQWLASSEWDHSIRLWNLASGTCDHVLLDVDDQANYFYGLAWSPDGQRLAGGTYRRGVLVWNRTTQQQYWSGQDFPTWIRHVVWSPDGKRLAGCGDDGIVYIFDAADGRLLQQLERHHSFITRVAWSPNGTRLASGGSGKAGGELFVWDVLSGNRLHSVSGHPDTVYAVAWGSSEEILVSGDSEGLLRWWDLKSGACWQTHEAHRGTVQSLSRSPDGTKLASCGDDGAIMLWDSHSGEYLQTVRRDRPYERLDITGIRGTTEAQKAILRNLGAVGNV